MKMEQLGKLMKVPVVGQAMGQLFPWLGLLAVIKQTMPAEGREAVSALRGWLNPSCFFSISEFEGSLPNDLYKDIHLHLESCQAYRKARSVSLFRKPHTSSVTMRLANSNDLIVDVYKGMTVWWTHNEGKEKHTAYRGPYSSGGTSSRMFTLKIRKRDKARLLPEYLDFITRNASTYSGKTREIKIFTNGDNIHHYTTSGTRRLWEELPYKHPSTFHTLAIDPCLKANIIADLTSFTTDQLFYHNAGRAWKRGYLLYGPPGTGKSSMIAAMANFLKYDIYDLELSQVRSNGDLRQLLIQTSNRSIIVLEDIDCSVKFTHSRSGGRIRSTPMMPGDAVTAEDDPNRVTLSGLLNFVDGLWSCCGDERIIVFTTNHVEKLDKALLRPGRMDMQIELSYCTFPAFQVLAHNYLSIRDHPLFAKLESAFLVPGRTITPAQVAELLIKDKSNVDLALQTVISALETPVPQVTAEDEETTLLPSSQLDSKLVVNLISTLQGVIKVLEKNTVVDQSLNLQTSSRAQPLSELSANMKDLVRATLVKNKGDADSAIEGVIPVLESRLPISESVEQPSSNASTANGHSTSATGCSSSRAANGSSSQVANGVLH